MNRKLLAAAGIAFAATAITAPVQAGPFDKLKKKVEKVKKKAEEVEQAAAAVEGAVDDVKNGRVPTGAVPTGRTRLGSPLGGVRAMDGSVPGGRNYPKTASRGNFAGVAGPIPAKFANATKCANIGLGNAFVAQAGNYTFTQGLSTEKRGGLINRKPVTASNGCVMPAMGSGDVLYVEVDRAKYDKHKYAVQCAAYDGSEQLDNTDAPPANNYTGKDVMLHTGNSLGYEPTATGSNSDRSGAYDKYLKSRGREMITFNMPSLHQNKQGKDFYCQHYNKATGESTVAFAFRRGPVPR